MGESKYSKPPLFEIYVILLQTTQMSSFVEVADWGGPLVD